MLRGTGKHGTPSRWRSPQAEQPHRKQGGWWVDGEEASGYSLAADLESIDPDPLPSFWRPLPDDCEPAYWRVSRAIRDTGLAIFERPLPPGRQGTATADTIVVSATIPDSRNRLATLLHEYAHVLAHFGPLAREKDERQCELGAESACYVVLAHLGIDYPFSRDYLLHYKVTPDLLYQSLAAVQGIVKRMMRAVEGAQAERGQAV